MKKLTNKSLLFLLLIFVFSCSKKSELENVFIGDKQDYWNYKDDCQNSKGIYFKFNKNSTYDKFLSKPIDEGKGFDLFNDDGDLISDTRTWFIKNDSIFTWHNADYKIEFYNKDSIILSYFHYKEKEKKCRVTLKKVRDE